MSLAGQTASFTSVARCAWIGPPRPVLGPACFRGLTPAAPSRRAMAPWKGCGHGAPLRTPLGQIRPLLRRTTFPLGAS